MITTEVTINNYIEALTTRAEQQGEGRLDYAMGFLFSTLTSLKLDSYELESLQRDTENLKTLAQQTQP